METKERIVNFEPGMIEFDEDDDGDYTPSTLSLPPPRELQKYCMVIDVRKHLAAALAKNPNTQDLQFLLLNCIEEYVHSSKIIRIDPLPNGLGWKVWYWDYPDLHH